MVRVRVRVMHVCLPWRDYIYCNELKTLCVEWWRTSTPFASAVNTRSPPNPSIFDEPGVRLFCWNIPCAHVACCQFRQIIHPDYTEGQLHSRSVGLWRRAQSVIIHASFLSGRLQATSNPFHWFISDAFLHWYHPKTQRLNKAHYCRLTLN